MVPQPHPPPNRRILPPPTKKETNSLTWPLTCYQSSSGSSLSVSRNALLDVLRDRDGDQNWTNLLTVIPDKKVY